MAEKTVQEYKKELTVLKGQLTKLSNENKKLRSENDKLTKQLGTVGKGKFKVRLKYRCSHGLKGQIITVDLKTRNSLAKSSLI